MPPSSDMCGHYVVYWLTERYRNFDLDFTQFCNVLDFDADVNKNDKLVMDYIESERNNLKKT